MCSVLDSVVRHELLVCAVCWTVLSVMNSWCVQCAGDCAEEGREVQAPGSQHGGIVASGELRSRYVLGFDSVSALWSFPSFVLTLFLDCVVIHLLVDLVICSYICLFIHGVLQLGLKWS